VFGNYTRREACDLQNCNLYLREKKYMNNKTTSTSKTNQVKVEKVWGGKKKTLCVDRLRMTVCDLRT
jgi:hypothetical protein